MIFSKRDKWKSTESSKLFSTEEEAVLWESKIPAIVSPSRDGWSPIEKLRGRKSTCDDCDCDPCECNEWKLVEETLSTTDSSMEETF